MNMPLKVAASPLREQAENTLIRARRLPRGPNRNDLRQLGVGLLRLYKDRSDGRRPGASEELPHANNFAPEAINP